MNRIGTIRLAWGIAAGASILLLVDLFLAWQRVEVEVAGTVSTETTSNGWSGWGFVAGVLAILLAVRALGFVRSPASARGRGLFALLPLGLLLTTVAAVFTGDTEISVAGVVGVEVTTDLWPTWAGLVLGSVASGAALVALALDTAAVEKRPATPAVHTP